MVLASSQVLKPDGPSFPRTDSVWPCEERRVSSLDLSPVGDEQEGVGTGLRIGPGLAVDYAASADVNVVGGIDIPVDILFQDPTLVIPSSSGRVSNSIPHKTFSCLLFSEWGQRFWPVEKTARVAWTGRENWNGVPLLGSCSHRFQVLTHPLFDLLCIMKARAIRQGAQEHLSVALTAEFADPEWSHPGLPGVESTVQIPVSGPG